MVAKRSEQCVNRLATVGLRGHDRSCGVTHQRVAPVSTASTPTRVLIQLPAGLQQLANLVRVGDIDRFERRQQLCSIMIAGRGALR